MGAGGSVPPASRAAAVAQGISDDAIEAYLSESMCVGIDLGNSTSKVAVWRDTAAVAQNDRLSKTTPSCVAFEKNGSANVGESARTAEGGAVARDFVRRLGASPEDAEAAAAALLVDMRRTAEAATGGPVRRAVISVPGGADDARRAATRRAAERAGLYVVGVVEATLCTAVAYALDLVSFDCVSYAPGPLLVVDVGGSSCELAIIFCENGRFHTVATAREAFGGDDLTNRLYDYVAKGVGGASSPKAKRQLWDACEAAKIDLSSATTARVCVTLDGSESEHAATLTRAHFEALTAEYLARIMMAVAAALKKAKVSKKEIHDVVLAGGSSRVPKIVSLLKHHFRKEPCEAVAREEGVAVGAAVYGALATGLRGVPAGLHSEHLRTFVVPGIISAPTPPSAPRPPPGILPEDIEVAPPPSPRPGREAAAAAALLPVEGPIETSLTADAMGGGLPPVD